MLISCVILRIAPGAAISLGFGRVPRRSPQRASEQESGNSVVTDVDFRRWHTNLEALVSNRISLKQDKSCCTVGDRPSFPRILTASLDNDMRPALLSGAVLHGPARPDLIRDELLCEIFAATVAAHPSAIAMITAAGKLTYAEVDAKAERLARGLLQKGVRPGPDRRALDAARPRTSDRPDRHRQDRRRLASVRRRCARRADRHLPFRRRSLGHFDHAVFRGECSRVLPGLDLLPGLWPRPKTLSARQTSMPARSVPARTTRPISSTPRARPARPRAS